MTKSAKGDKSIGHNIFYYTKVEQFLRDIIPSDDKAFFFKPVEKRESAVSHSVSEYNNFK